METLATLLIQPFRYIFCLFEKLNLKQWFSDLRLRITRCIFWLLLSCKSSFQSVQTPHLTYCEKFIFLSLSWKIFWLTVETELKKINKSTFSENLFPHQANCSLWLLPPYTLSLHLEKLFNLIGFIRHAVWGWYFHLIYFAQTIFHHKRDFVSPEMCSQASSLISSVKVSSESSRT